jgi:hypothetical protein
MIDLSKYTHDLMVAAIQDMCGAELQHGRDFLVAHPVDPATGEQSGDPLIVVWKTTAVTQPTDAAVTAHFLANETALRSAYVRSFRDEALFNTDGRATAPDDAPDDVKALAAQWAVYRQALRDIPNQSGFPCTVIWPDSPANQELTNA